jgi:hypothetical protein
LPIDVACDICGGAVGLELDNIGAVFLDRLR